MGRKKIDVDVRNNRVSSNILYNLLVHYSLFSRHKYLSRVWWKVWQNGERHYSGPVRSSIHGYPVYLNFGYTYPVYSRLFSDLNNPLIELVHQCHSVFERKINIVDVGAAIGDTILLIQANCPGAIDNFYCLDGDPQFFSFLLSNLAHFKNGHFYCVTLSDSIGFERSLIKTHPGTASAQGNEFVSTTTLDSIINRIHLSTLDLLKIDVDGLDGKVLKGGSEILKEFRPSVIFEWAPIQCEQTGNNWVDHFEILEANGYTKFIWFDKFGKFSHFMHHLEKTEIDNLARLCIRNQYETDWHYDVVALHEENPIEPILIAEVKFARNRRSHY